MQQPKIDENLIYVSVETVAKAKCCSLRAVRKACSNNKYITRFVKSNLGGGNAGKSYEILLSSLEPEIQEKILKESLNTPSRIQAAQAADSLIGSHNCMGKQASFSLFSFGGSTETSKNPYILPPVSLNSTTANVVGEVQSLLPYKSNCTSFHSVVPQKAKQLALAKVDLINHWEAYRNNQKNKASADKEFIILYNSKHLSKALFLVLGEVSLKSLYRWKKILNENGNNYQSLIPNYKYSTESECNTKMSELEKKYFLDLMLHPSKMSVGNAYRLVKFVLERQGISDICSVKTYERFANNFKRNKQDIWILMREGQKALSDKVLPYLKRDISKLEVGDVLIADGHTLDFQVVNPFSGKPVRATMVAYQDWKSADIAGYEIMLSENTQCIASALRNSIIRLGKYPKVAYQDNGRAFKSKFFRGSKNFDECGFYGLFGKLGIVPVFAKPYNAKAKPIERFFREFTQTGESLINSYVGNNIVNKPAYLMRNEKFHKSIHDDFIPTIEQAIQLIESWLVFYRSQPCPHVAGKTIGEVFNEGSGAGVNIDELDDLMMAQEERKIGRNGIKFLNSFYYNESLYGLKDSVIIKYNLYDLSYVKVYSQKGEYLGKAETMLEIHPLAKIMGDNKDLYNYKRALKQSKKAMNETIKTSKKTVPKLQKLLDWQEAKEVKKTKVEKPEKVKNKYKIEYQNEAPIEIRAKTDKKYDIL